MKQMRVSKSSAYLNEYPGDEIREGDIVNVREHEEFAYEFEHPRSPGAWLVAYEHELEPIDDGRLSVGTRVRCINDTDLNGCEGTVVKNDGWSGYPYRIQWDDRAGDALSDIHSHGGSWSDGAIEVVTDEDDDAPTALEMKNAALKIAAFVFSQYKEQHLAKETDEATMKALMNMGLEKLMNDALEAG